MSRAVLIGALLAGLAGSAQAASLLSHEGLSGVTVANPGEEVVLYRARIQGGPPPAETLLRIGIVIEAVTTVTNADLAELRMYESIDNSLDGADTQLSTVPSGSINIGAETDVPANDQILPAAAARWYLVTAVIGLGAVEGHAFRLGANTDNIDIDANGDGTTDQQLDGSVVANDADRVEIGPLGAAPGAGAGDTQAPQPIPISNLWVVGVAMAGYGAYRIVVSRRRVGGR